MDIYRKLKTLKKSQLLKIYHKLNSKEIKEIKKIKKIKEIKKNTRNDIINLILQPLQIKRRIKRRMKYRMKRKSDRITILDKYIISERKIVKIHLDTNYFKLLPDNVNEIYAYKSNSGILWHLALIEEGIETFKKHAKSYTTGFVLNFEIQQYLESDRYEYEKIYDKTEIFNEIKSYTPKLITAGIDKISQGGCNQDDFKFFEEPDNIKIRYYKVKDTETVKDKWVSQEYNIPEKQTMKYDCPLIKVDGTYYPNYYMSKSVKILIEEKYGNIPSFLSRLIQKSDPKKIIEFVETIYSEIGDEISKLMEEYFEIVEQETDREPIYSGTFRMESEQTNYSVFRVKIRNIFTKNEYMLYFMLYYVKNYREGSVDNYNLPIMILDIKNDASKDFIYKNCVISTGLYTCKPYEYRKQSLQIFDSVWVMEHRDISRSKNYTLVSKYLSNMWPLNKLKMIEGLGHDLVDRRKKVVIPSKQNDKQKSSSWLYY